MWMEQRIPITIVVSAAILMVVHPEARPDQNIRRISNTCSRA